MAYKRVKTTVKCKPGKVRQGVGGRCVKKCAANERRRNHVCKTFTRRGKTYNELSGRFVDTKGIVGQWIRGIGPSPKGYGKKSYKAQLKPYL